MRDTIITAIEEKYEYFSRVWYKQPKREGKACWTAFYDESDSLALALDGMVISYCKPLYRDDKSLLGIISTDISLFRLSRIFTTETSFADSYFFMTGDEGRYYLHPDSTQLFTKTIFSDADPDKNPDIIALGHQMTTGQQGSMSVRINGKPCIVSYQPVRGTNWSLALVCPERTLLHNYNLLAYIVSALLIVGLLLILIFSSFTVAQAILPLYNLAGKLQRLANGHYDETIPLSRHHDVVGRLQNSFAAMQESLNRHVSDIRQMNVEAERRNEELVRTSELAKEANRQKSLFIQNVSHQIRTPLNIIMGFSQVLKEGKSLMPEEESKGITAMMRHNALMLDRMVLMLFDSSARGTTEELYANRHEEVFCNELARDCIEGTRKQYADLTISFYSEVHDDFHIHTSRVYLERSLRELLYNAAKYSDGQNIAICIHQTKDYVLFIVEDTGPGIAEEDAPRLFEMFTKVNDLSEGLGLGLALAKRHLTNLGGDITLDTSYQAGCRFIVKLPIGN
jgi:signal transduction histidine kinase